MFPLILITLLQYSGKYLRPMIVSMFMVSLGFSAWQSNYRDSAAFYLLHSRAWELLLGTILALDIVPQISNQILKEIGGCLGVGFIGAAIFGYTHDTPFPGAAALLPCLGAALVIYSGVSANTLITRTLSSPPLVFIGLISYSLYLWHWPVIVFHKAGLTFISGLSSAVDKAVLVAVCFVPATLSWWLIERPLRRGALIFSRYYLFGAAAAISVAIVALASWGIASGGIPSRFSPAELEVASYLRYDPSID